MIKSESRRLAVQDLVLAPKIVDASQTQVNDFNFGLSCSVGVLLCKR